MYFNAGSYVPRSASWNLTIDMFGQSVNLLEFGGRAQGLETVIERYFGPGNDFETAMKREKRAVVRDDVINTIDRRVSVRMAGLFLGILNWGDGCKHTFYFFKREKLH